MLIPFLQPIIKRANIRYKISTCLIFHELIFSREKKQEDAHLA